ncbi:MAG: hypothetical protein AB1806_12575 [Acidobacteriota bacterium]
MATTHRNLSLVRCLTLASVVGTIPGIALAPAVGQGLDGRVQRVRPRTAEAATLLRHAIRQSPTVARLVRALDGTDLIVYIETGCLRVKAALRIATATPHARFIRITINTPELECRMIGELAHELQHALEIAGAPDVRDDATLRQYYEVKGIRTPEGGYCTLEARRVGALALYEVNSAAGLRGVR